MNSATMPRSGRYELREISAQDFFDAIQENAQRLQSSIGYPQNAKLIEAHTGVRITLSREVTDLQEGDEMLIMRLKYRPANKGNTRPTLEDFEFFHAHFNRI